MPRITRRQLLVAGAAVGAVAFPAARGLAAVGGPVAPEAVTQAQTPLPSARIPKYVTPLRTFAGSRVSASSFTTRFVETPQLVLPSSVYPPDHAEGTWVWAYQVDGRPPSWPGVTVEAQRNTPTTVTYVNSLPRSSRVQPVLTVDQTIHWADPLNAVKASQPYTGPMPAVVHLHGAEVPSAFDGVPEAWFTPDGRHGPAYCTANQAATNAAVYRYPNTQPATALWFHDHTLGITRITVFSGMAAFYLVRDEFDTGCAGNPLNLPADKYEVELMLQDRLFDTNGQLRFPDGSNTDADLNGPPSNPLTHPFWIPEFFGDAMVVNGRTWPVLAVEPRRYRFRFLNACNARFLRMNLTDPANASSATPPSAVACWQIGTDGGLLDRPVKLNDPADPNAGKVFLAPSERADVIIDFGGLAGRSLILTNDGLFPFPSGGPPDPNLDGQLMRFDVTQRLSSPDTSFDPASGTSLRGGSGQPPAIVRLADPATGAVAAGVQPATKRQLVVYEQETVDCAVSTVSNGPLEAFLNNTKWNGLRDGTTTPVPGSRATTNLFMTELPRVGATEQWELLDTTNDAHPIHIHLIQFQVLNRQAVDVNGYRAAWAAAFPGGAFAGQQCDGSFGRTNYPAGQIIPGYGPPGDYLTPNADGALGGNPAIGPFLQGPVLPPDPAEAGWKDTFKISPGMVNRVLVRWAPTETAVGDARPGVNLFAFDPTSGPGYVWHCHILDHEDNEMMRPYAPVK